MRAAAKLAKAPNRCQVAKQPKRHHTSISPASDLVTRTSTNTSTRTTVAGEVIYPVLGPIPNGAGTMVLRVVFLFH